MITDEYLEAILGANPDLDRAVVVKAINFAKLAHDGQKRKSGEPFFTHVAQTALILAQWKMDTDTVAAGLLHDSIEDGAAKGEDIAEQFGSSVAFLVEGVTKLGKLRLGNSQSEVFVENLRKMFVAMARDIRVVIVKLADRLHNMRTLHYLAPDKQLRIARETLEIYAPLADRLQMGATKAELEDLAFSFLYPADYVWVKELADTAFSNIENHIEEINTKLYRGLESHGVKAEIKSRRKHLYSLYRKLLRPENDRDIAKIHDLAAFRILVATIPDCYTALGVVNHLFKPVSWIPISDFVAIPKPNGYRSIHVKVYGPNDRIIEIQIRTHAMHYEAELGVASHFYYAELKAQGVADEKLEAGVVAPNHKLAWVKQLADWHNEVKDNKQFYDGLRKDFLSDRIFVFTPKGDVKDLPAGSTPIDFAYSVHTSLGHRAMGARVNGKATGFDHSLKSGDVCEIFVSEKSKPKSDWLKYVVTSAARREIHKELKKNL